MARAVFLDRDGVLVRPTVVNGRPYPPAALQEMQILTGAAEACQALRREGFSLVVVTNQPDVARGTQTRERVEEMHRSLMQILPIDGIRVCYHDDDYRCECRKPKPGMIIAAALERGIDLSASFLVGDRWRDMVAGRRAGCRTVFIDYRYAEHMPVEPDHFAGSLSEASEWILRSD